MPVSILRLTNLRKRIIIQLLRSRTVSLRGFVFEMKSESVNDTDNEHGKMSATPEKIKSVRNADAAVQIFGWRTDFSTT